MSGANFPETVDGLPNICGSEDMIADAMRRSGPIILPESEIDLGRVKSAFAIALHMHQPLIPAGGEDLPNARIISNLQFIMEHQEIKDAHSGAIAAAMSFLTSVSL